VAAARLGRVVTVGASLAGLSALEALRQDGYDGELIAVGAEAELPYDRPPLSKQVLRGAEPIHLRDAAALAATKADFLMGRRATSLDVENRRVRLDDGSDITYGSLVVATGVVARRLPFGHDLAGVHTLRTLDDAVALRGALPRRPRVVVVGGGFIGCEVAASLRTLDLEVALVEGAAAPLTAALGPEIGGIVADLHRKHGVDVRCGVGVAGLEGDRHVTGVRLTEGSVLPADLVVVGVGGRPATGWLETSGLDLSDGVGCDEHGRAAPGVWAAGDVARWFSPLFGEHVRVEHWTTAGEQAAVVARNILAAGPDELVSFAGVPYFWSDQYDVRIQFAGHRRAGDPVMLLPQEEPGRHVGVVERDGVLVGAVTINAPRELLRYRGLIAARTPVADLLPADAAALR
jgi:NADPH-dependent 2,4-dienoyl-CoA reductase/sulfur reductase-like enzyme